MIAIVKIGGHQALVKEGETIEVDKLDIEVGKKVKFDTLLVSEEDGTGFQIGDPILKGITVEAKILEHGRSKKITVFKMKPRKRYRRTLGHRQDYTLIEIAKIGTGNTEKVAPKKEKIEKTAVKKTEAKKAPTKKTTAKKK